MGGGVDGASVASLDGDEILTATHRIGHRLPNMSVRGMDEAEVFAFAPTMTCDRVHWDTVDDFDARILLPALGPEAYSRQWSDGQHRVWVPAGQGHFARDEIRRWCLDHGVEPVNMRVEPAVVFRNVDLIPAGLLPELVGATVDWLYPRTYAIRRKLVADLDLVDDDDVRSMMYLFVHDHVDRYDPGRQGANGTLNFAAFVIGKLRTWPQDAARSVFGRAVVSDRMTLARAVDAIASTQGRPATEADRAAALGTSVTDLRRRESAISALSNMRHQQSLFMGPADGADRVNTVEVAGDGDVAIGAADYDSSAEMTRAVLAAVNDPAGKGRRAQDPLALAAVYLAFWEELSRPQVARELEVLPKTANAAVGRVLGRLKAAGLR
ncbi:MAG: hypothetical protein ACYC3K_00910 [Candidatus Nanopelagicales bacterium]